DGSLRKINLFGQELSGKALYDEIEKYARKAFVYDNEEDREKGRDILWYLWNGADSPLYGRDKMTTFERYFVEDTETYKETKDNYYTLLESPETARTIFEDFGLEYDYSHIINGHVPIKQAEGENPIKCGGKVIIIDGGFSQPYHKVTGIAGYTLFFNSYGLMLSAHEPFESVEKSITSGKDMKTYRVASQVSDRRILVEDTDNGRAIKENIKDLKDLIKAYRSGVVRQKG
ncbi:MAG: fructose-bisphosphatase class III, partial [Ruminococcus sp.]